MAYRSAKQRRFLHANKPGVAKQFEADSLEFPKISTKKQKKLKLKQPKGLNFNLGKL